MALRTVPRGILRDLGKPRLPSDELAEKIVAEAILAHLERCAPASAAYLFCFLQVPLSSTPSSRVAMSHVVPEVTKPSRVENVAGQRLTGPRCRE